MTNKEKISESKSVLEEAILEYKQIFDLAKNQLVETHSKELDEYINNLLNENEVVSDKKEPVVVKEQAPFGGTVQETFTQEPINGMSENFAEIDMTNASLKEVEEAFDNANANDEFNVVASDNNSDFTINDIENEVNEVMAEIQAAEMAQQPSVAPQQVAAPVQAPVAPVEAGLQQPQEVDSFIKMKQMHEEMGKMLENLENEKMEKELKENFHSKMTEMFGEGYENNIGNDQCGQMYETWKKSSPKGEKPKEDVSEVAPAAAPVANAVEEAHVSTLSGNKKVGAESQPRIESGKDYAKNKIRVALQKEQDERIQKRIDSLVNENLKLTKEVNKSKKEIQEALKLNEGYKLGIQKYRNQLNEMALLNQNIANVNNILVNENFELTTKDKETLIKRFSNVKSISESTELYNTVIAECTEKKKTITESVVEKIANNTVVETASSKVIQESVEKPGSEINEHVAKMKKNMFYKKVS